MTNKQIKTTRKNAQNFIRDNKKNIVFALIITRDEDNKFLRRQHMFNFIDKEEHLDAIQQMNRRLNELLVVGLPKKEVSKN